MNEKKIYQVNYVSFDPSDGYVFTEFGTPTADKKKATADFKKSLKNTRGSLKDDKKDGLISCYNETKSSNRSDFSYGNGYNAECHIRIELVEFTIKED
jgi:hypothetical protein